MSPRSKSSERWLQEHFSDQYVKKAQKSGYRARSAFKLLELQNKDHFIKPGMMVIDLGAAPGGWSQVVSQVLKGKGRVLASDLLPIEPISGVEFLQGDIRGPAFMTKLFELMRGEKADLVLSDMAPNVSGIKTLDQARARELFDLALYFAMQTLKPEGIFVTKVFQGSEFQDALLELKRHFQSVLIRKPEASRSRSSEVYILAKGFHRH